MTRRDLMLRRVRNALAELGYPPEAVFWADGALRFEPHQLPYAVAWQAGAIIAPSIGETYGCWACWTASYHQPTSEMVRDCRAGNCAHPDGPKTPPRHLLQRTATR